MARIKKPPPPHFISCGLYCAEFNSVLVELFNVWFAIKIEKLAKGVLNTLHGLQKWHDAIPAPCNDATRAEAKPYRSLDELQHPHKLLWRFTGPLNSRSSTVFVSGVRRDWFYVALDCRGHESWNQNSFALLVPVAPNSVGFQINACKTPHMNYKVFPCLEWRLITSKHMSVAANWDYRDVIGDIKRHHANTETHLPTSQSLPARLTFKLFQF